MKPARAERYRREHRATIARLHEAAGRPTAPRRTRIRLAVGYLAAVAVMAATGIAFDGPSSLLPWLASLAVIVASVTVPRCPRT